MGCVTEAGPRRCRQFLLELYDAGLAAADGREAVRRALAGTRSAGVWAVAVGKAASAMAQGAADALGQDIERLLVITKYGHGAPFAADVQVMEAGHPVPDAASLQAGAALVRFLQQAPATAPLLFLISGGTSALVEVLPEGYGSNELAELNRLLLAGGQDIGTINAIRKRVSCIKGGRLARYTSGHDVRQLLISDVPGDAPDVIGSGLLVPDLSKPPEPGTLPDWIEQMMGRAGPPSAAGNAPSANIATEIVATNRSARRAVGEKVRAAGLTVFDHREPLAGEPRRCAEALVAEVQAGPPGIYLWGGETPVTLPPKPGRGGRCQALALEIARRIHGCDNLFFLCGATDGTDGPTEDAGGVVDGGTIARGEQEGFDAARAAAQADAGTFLEAAGDLIQTGPTGTNVMDLVIACKTDGD